MQQSMVVILPDSTEYANLCFSSRSPKDSRLSKSTSKKEIDIERTCVICKKIWLLRRTFQVYIDILCVARIGKSAIWRSPTFKIKKSPNFPSN